MNVFGKIKDHAEKALKKRALDRAKYHLKKVRKYLNKVEKDHISNTVLIESLRLHIKNMESRI